MNPNSNIPDAIWLIGLCACIAIAVFCGGCKAIYIYPQNCQVNIGAGGAVHTNPHAEASSTVDESDRFSWPIWRDTPETNTNYWRGHTETFTTNVDCSWEGVPNEQTE
jgi:hypothetical protein